MLIRCFGQNTNDAFDRCLLPECQTSRETLDNRSWGRPLPVSLSHEEVSFGGWLREWFRRPESRMDRGIRRPDSSQAGSRRLQGDRPEARQRNRAAGIVGRDRQIEKRGAIVVARRLMQVGRQVLRYAIAGGLATRVRLKTFAAHCDPLLRGSTVLLSKRWTFPSSRRCRRMAFPLKPRAAWSCADRAARCRRSRSA